MKKYCQYNIYSVGTTFYRLHRMHCIRYGLWLVLATDRVLVSLCVFLCVSVCLLVTFMSHTKMVELIEMPFGV